MPKAQGVKQIASNRKAFHDYFILDRYEAGIELFGTEVKSIRAGTLNLKDSYCSIKNGEIFVRGMHISPYEKGNIFNRDPVRTRRLLMHRKEILKLQQRVMQEGIALIPLSLYFKDSRALQGQKALRQARERRKASGRPRYGPQHEKLLISSNITKEETQT